MCEATGLIVVSPRALQWSTHLNAHSISCFSSEVRVTYAVYRRTGTSGFHPAHGMLIFFVGFLRL